MSITENVRMARQKINAAAESAGRSGSEVRLLAATKMNAPEAVQEAIRAGVDICAENPRAGVSFQKCCERLRPLLRPFHRAFAEKQGEIPRSARWS